MTRRLPIVALLVLGSAFAAWLAIRHGGAPGEPAGLAESENAIGATGSRDSPPIAPSSSRRPPMPAPAAIQATARRTVFDEFLASREYRALYDRLSGTAEGASPKGRLVLYEMLRECVNVTGGVPWPFAPRRVTADKRDEFIAGIAPTDPNRERRIAAFEKFTADRCAGVSNVTLSQEELLRLLRDSAAGGEPAAKALLIEQDLWAARRASSGSTASPTDGQVQDLQRAAASRDPEAIRVAGRVLANGWSDYALRVGPDALPIEPRPFVNAWLVLACEYGAPCGPDTPRMQQACAVHGHCDAQSYPDYLSYYGSTPHDSALLMQYRSLIRAAIESGDWSQIQVLRGQPQAGNRQTFIPGPR